MEKEPETTMEEVFRAELYGISPRSFGDNLMNFFEANVRDEIQALFEKVGKCIYELYNHFI